MARRFSPTSTRASRGPSGQRLASRPDPIDSALFDAQPVPLWPKYVGLWVDLLGGDGLAQPGAPLADDAEGPRGKKKAPRDLVGEASSRLRRSRSRSIEMERGETERSSANRSSLDHSPMDVDAPSSDEASARAFVGASLAAYDAFVGEVLQLCQTLNLEVVPLRRGPGGGAAEEEAGSVDRDADADATTRALALELGEGVAAADPGDARTFLSLVDLTCAALAAAPSAFVTRWLAPLVEHLAAFASAHPLMSGFYKIARVALAAGEDAGVFAAARRGDADARETATACRAFLRDVAAGGARLSEELRASALRLTLAAPEGLLTTSELAAPLRDALRLGLHHAPLAEAALDALEAWLARRGRVDDGGETDAALPSVVAALRPYVDRAPQEDGRELEADAASGVDPVAAGATGAGYREAKRAAKRGSGGSEASREASTPATVASTPASRGSSARWEARTPSWRGERRGRTGGGGERGENDDSGRRERRRFVFERRVGLGPDRRVGVEVSVGAGRGAVPRTDGVARRGVALRASLALTSSDRATKVAAAEFLHAATLLMVGRNARRPAPKGGDYARADAVPPHVPATISRILELAVDPEPVTKQLFSSLAYQLARWFTRNQAREAAETVALLDAITEGLAGGDEPGSGAADGAAARRRELCASLAAECLEWSVRHLPSGGGGGDQGGAAVNVKSILRRLFALMTHPEPSKRLGASVALRRSLVALRNFPAQCEAHALEILEAALRGLRSVENDPPRAGAEEAGALLARAAVRACARHAGALGRRPAAGRSNAAARSGRYRVSSLGFSPTASPGRSPARGSSRNSLAALVQRLPGYTTPPRGSTSVDARRRRKTPTARRGGRFASSRRRRTSARELFAPPRAADGSPVDRTGVLLAGASWLKSLVAALHWARWALERRVVRAEDLAPRPGRRTTRRTLSRRRRRFSEKEARRRSTSFLSATTKTPRGNKARGHRRGRCASGAGPG